MKNKQTKQMMLALAIMLALPAFVLCQMGDRKGSADQGVRKTISELAAALGKNDTATLERIYADDYTFVGDNGATMTKSQRIAAFKSGDIKYESVDMQVAQLHVFGDTAIAVTNTTSKFAPGTKIAGGKFVTTATFVKMKGRWQLVAASNIRLAE